jgi:hypothetical protein
VLPATNTEPLVSTKMSEGTSLPEPPRNVKYATNASGFSLTTTEKNLGSGGIELCHPDIAAWK